MLALLIAVHACILLREWYPRGNPLHDILKLWHFMLALTVFVLVFLRLGIRLFKSPPHYIKNAVARDAGLATRSKQTKVGSPVPQ